MEVYIAGKGIISAIGNDLSQTIISLLAGISGITPISILPTHHRFPAGEVKLSNDTLAEMAGLKTNMPRTALLSMIAAREAISDSDINDLGKWRTAFISANTIGGMDLTENFMEDFLKDNDSGDLSQVVYHDSGAVTQLVAKELNVNSYVTTISTACSSSANAIIYASRLIDNDKVDIAIAGGADALLRFTLNGFNALMILDSDFCTPFDENRKGLNLGEGAGYIVLVSERVRKEMNKKPLARLSGYANANDAYHQTASSEDGNGNYLAMSGALKMSGLAPGEIDYINLHGTGTINNDLSEGRALQRVFGGDVPKASSTKPYTGHTLGASGAIEAIFSLVALDQNVVFPNLRFKTRMKEFDFSPVTALDRANINHVLSNSFGFGGNCSSLIFSKVNE